MGPLLETLLATAWLLPAWSPALSMVLPVELRLQLEGAVLCPSRPWQRNSCFLFLADRILKMTAKRNYLKNEIKRGAKQTPHLCY